jgi:tetratricopeptide (TPR) repeat protein
MRVLPLYPNGHKRAQARISGLVLIVLFWVVGISYAQTVEEYYNKGVEYGAQGKFKEAENEFKRALEIDQFYGPAKECLKLTEDALAKRVENEVAIHLFKGVVYGIKGMWDEAITEYKKAIALNPNYADAHNILGLAYANKGMRDEAIAEFKKAIALNPNDAEAHNNLGVAYGNKGMLDEAITEFKKAIALNPNYAEAHYNLAVSYYYKGQHGLAIKHCDQAIELGYKVHPE